MKSKRKVLFGMIILLMILVFAGYIGMVSYYRQRFHPATWINGLYCTGKSIEEVTAELLSQIEAPIVIITSWDGVEYEIPLSLANYRMDYSAPLEKFMEEQNPWLWFKNFFSDESHELTPVVSFEQEILRGLYEEVEPIRTELEKPTDFVLSCSQKDGYDLKDNLSSRIDIEIIYQELLDAIDRGEYHVDLRKVDCLYNIPLTKQQKELAILWEKINAFQQCDIVYDMGQDELLDKIELTPNVMSAFLLTEENIPVLDESGSLVLEEAAVVEFVEGLAQNYDTYGRERKFQSSRGEVITISGGTYGTTIHQKKEIAFLMEALLSPDMHTGVKQKHIPEYKRVGVVRGGDDIGDTYVEVDMTEQKLYCYVDGEKKLETDVVTGNMRRGMDTPEGINYVYAKQKNRILRGPGYASPVKYWMPVNGGIGIHDASWRSEFGGEIYRTNGSHGCINVSSKIMPEIYEMIEVGTPVIMYY